MEEKEVKLYNNILKYLSPNLNNILYNIPDCYKEKIEEIRLRSGRPLMVYFNGHDYFITQESELRNKFQTDCYIVDKKEIEKVFQLISNYSVYAFEEEIKNGFITIKGGHRVGISGKVIYKENDVFTMKNISSLNIRLAREKIGVSDNIMRYLIYDKNKIYNTLIISPPQCGKTTLLRDIIRNVSDGMEKYNFTGLKVGIIDERSEISNVFQGYPQKDVGIRTDILDSCKKEDGFKMMIRAMSPNVIATDELGGKEDMKAIYEALKAGVKIIATVHGDDIEDIMTKPYLDQIINEKIFERIIVLDNSKGVGTDRKSVV